MILEKLFKLLKYIQNLNLESNLPTMPSYSNYGVNLEKIFKMASLKI